VSSARAAGVRQHGQRRDAYRGVIACPEYRSYDSHRQPALVMTLFSRPGDAQSHRTRLVLAEKNINVEIIDVEGPRLPEDLIDLNPYHSVPTLVDRDLVLYDARVIIDYIDEAFPASAADARRPVTRAQFRLALYRIERDWYNLARRSTRPVTRSRRPGEEGAEGEHPVECRGVRREALFPERRVLARRLRDRSHPVALPHYEIELPAQAARAILAYEKRVFVRPSFRRSLAEVEQEMRV